MRTLQAEDEIAGVGAALGAAFGGHLGVTTTSGPGVDLKAETIGLAVSLELPLLIIDIQRGGPSTGLPTKTEQSDLMLAMYGRHGEAPLPIVAAKSPSHCFYAAIEAARIALKYRTPVILLSDGYLANGSEPWRLPDVESLPDIRVPFADRAATSRRPSSGPTCATRRRWPVRGPSRARPGLEHRIGGIEKEDGTGNISYDPDNHELMTRLRAAKVAGIARDIPPVEVDADEGAEVLVLGWGSTYGSIAAAVRRIRARGLKVAQAHLVHLNPFPRNLGEVVGRYREVLVPEMNLGQLSLLIRGRVPRRRQVGEQGEGPAVQGRRDRRGLAGADRMTDTAVPVTTKKDWTSDQEVRWCPGCGDYSILTAVQMLMPELGVRRENTVFVSGIGCAARFPYYMNTYGMHAHPRPGAGHRHRPRRGASRPHVWVVTGDGDGLSIGGNHLIHALRRNVNITILLFNNQIYGLTKGQYSPTSEVGKVTKSTPFGSLDHPFNPISLALGAEATFVARTHDMDRKHMRRRSGGRTTIAARRSSRSTRTATSSTTAPSSRSSPRRPGPRMLIALRHGEPIRFGPEDEQGVVLDGQGRARIVDVADVGEDAILVHDEAREEPGLAFMLSRLARGPHEPTPVGVFRAVERPDYGDEVDRQLAAAQERQGPGDLATLLRSGGTWEV